MAISCSIDNMICCRLRICGSQQIHDFLDAFDYYSLWPLEPNARQFLRNTNIGHIPDEWRANEQVLYGKDSATVITGVPKVAPGLNDCKKGEEEIDLSEPVGVATREHDLGTPLTEGVTLIPSSVEDEIEFEESRYPFSEARASEQSYDV